MRGWRREQAGGLDETGAAEIRQRLVRVIGLPEEDDDDPLGPLPPASPPPRVPPVGPFPVRREPFPRRPEAVPLPPVDTAPFTEAGPLPDAGPFPDAGRFADAGQFADAGPFTEARPFPDPAPGPGGGFTRDDVADRRIARRTLTTGPFLDQAPGPGPGFPGDDVADHRAARRALAAFDPGRRGVRALAVVAVLVLAVAGFLAWRARPAATPVVAVEASGSGGAPAAGPAASSPAGTVVVSVGGRVRNPGVVTLPAGSRVADAIAAAGGVLPGTDLSYVNLARKLVDGELLLIGVSPAPGQPAGGPSAAVAGGGPVNLNTASLAELQTLPGVGPVLAQRIVDHREQKGGFKTVAELRQVEGIGDAKYAQLKDKVTV